MPEAARIRVLQDIGRFAMVLSIGAQHYVISWCPKLIPGMASAGPAGCFRLVGCGEEGMREAGGSDDDADGGGFVRVSPSSLHRASVFLSQWHFFPVFLPPHTLQSRSAARPGAARALKSPRRPLLPFSLPPSRSECQ